jgi:hypothetical protein
VTGRDPLGRRALFSVPAQEVPLPEPEAPERDGTGGGWTVFSARQRRPGTVVLECSACQARTRVGWLEFLRRHFPVWLWLPWRRHSRWMSCPACDRRTWLAVSWLG